MMDDFSKKKFLLLTLRRQHTHCSALLRLLYEQLLSNQFDIKTWQFYHSFIQWMNGPDCGSPTLQWIADRYHWHLQQGQIFKKEHRLLPQIRKGDRENSEDAWPIAIYLDQIRSAHNVGSIIRTVEALALGELYFSRATPFITHKQVQDTSMGAAEWVICHQEKELESLPRPIIALETSPQALPVYDFIFPSSFTLVVGNEEYGCSEKTLELADFLLEIPLRGRKNSLNVANAFAMVASEIYRQKHKGSLLDKKFKNNHSHSLLTSKKNR